LRQNEWPDVVGQKPEEPAVAARKQPATDASQPLDVKKLFAGTCGWCHSDGGRVPAKAQN
jgi:mono/diheme cytochrome c family protein